MSKKNTARLRRSRKTRAKQKELDVIRLSVHRTPQHIYAQVFDAAGANVIACASTLEAAFADDVATGNIASAEKVGELIAQRIQEKGIDRVAFDRSGYKYHGRIKALAESVRKSGINI